MINKNSFLILIIISTVIVSCKKKQSQHKESLTVNNILKKDSIKPKQKIIYTDGFDFPVGKPDANGYYNAQKFTKNDHLGDDWNGVKGGNSDLGDPIYTIANGYVTFAQDVKGGWGNVIRITHHINSTTKVESLYAHCDSILITKNQYVKKGQKIATIGTANGIYLAHLHFEIRDSLQMPIGGGYAIDTTGYLNPTRFIKQHRN